MRTLFVLLPPKSPWRGTLLKEIKICVWWRIWNRELKVDFDNSNSPSHLGEGWGGVVLDYPLCPPGGGIAAKR